MRSAVIWIGVLAAACLLGCGPTFSYMAKLEKETAALRPLTTAPRWERVERFHSTDLLEFIDARRFLVGTMTFSNVTTAASRGPLRMYDAPTGRLLWTAKRASDSLLRYQVLGTAPHLTVMGSNGSRTILSSLSLRSGRTRWRYRCKGQCDTILQDGQIYIVSRKRRRIRRVDMTSGAVRWSRGLPAGVVGGRRALAVMLTGNKVLVTGVGVAAFAVGDGALRWRLANPRILADKRSAVLPAAEGIVLWNAGRTALVDPATGKVRWEHGAPSGIKNVMGAQGRIYRLLTTGRPGATDQLEALDAAQGQRLWSVDLKGAVVSPLLATQGLLVCSTDTQVVGLQAQSGAEAFRSAIPPLVASRSPSNAKFLGLPDHLHLRGHTLYLSRADGGVVAYGLPTGQQQWVQANYNADKQLQGYSADAYIGALRASSKVPLRAPRRGGYLPLHQPGPNNFLVAAQASHAYVMQRTAAVLSNRRSTRAERKAAIGTRMLSVRSTMTKMRVSSAMGRLQAGASAGLAVAGALATVGEAIRYVIQAKQQQNFRERLMLQLEAVARMHRSAFRGKYYLRPFAEMRGIRGLTLVDLDTGKRSDLLFSPGVGALVVFAMDLHTYGLDSSLKWLVLFGVGMDPRRYQKIHRWHSEFPRPSLLAFSLRSLRFTRENNIKARVRKALFKGAKVNTRITNAQIQQLNLFTRFMQTILKNQPALAQEMLALKQISPNHRYAGMSLLHYAAGMGRAQIVAHLLAAGAKLNAKTTTTGQTATDLACDTKNNARLKPAVRRRRAKTCALLQSKGGRRAR